MEVYLKLCSNFFLTQVNAFAKVWDLHKLAICVLYVWCVHKLLLVSAAVSERTY
jgi:hypothetical protein